MTGRVGCLDVEDAEHGGWVLTLQNVQGNIVDGNARGSFAVRRAMMSMAVKYDVCTMPVDDLRQA